MGGAVRWEGGVLDLRKSEHLRVLQMDAIGFSTGDSIKITDVGKDLNGRRLDNGTPTTSKNIDRKGRIQLANGLLIDARCGHWMYGYDASQSSQGKTAQEVFCVQSSVSFRATSMEQLYVSISRGKKRVRNYTDDCLQLQAAMGNTAIRISAFEFTGLADQLFMNGGPSGKNWTERIAEGKSWRRDQLKDLVERLAAERNVGVVGVKKNTYVAYLDMRRANLTSNSKNRSKGYPPSLDSKRDKKKTMSDPYGVKRFKRPDPETPKAEVKAASKMKVAEPSRGAKRSSVLKSGVLRHLGNTISANGENLSEVVGRTKREAETSKCGAKRAIRFGYVKITPGELDGNPKSREARMRTWPRRIHLLPNHQPDLSSGGVDELWKSSERQYFVFHSRPPEPR